MIAGTYLNNAIETYTEMLPPTHPNVGTAQYYLGYYHLVRNDANSARNHFKIAAKVLPRDIADLANLQSLARKHLACINTILRKDPSFKATKFRKRESVDAKPKDLIPIKRVAPVYPATAQRAGIEGYVDVTFTVNEQGRPIDIEILYRCNGPYFDESTIRAVKLFEYEPVIRNGKPVTYPVALSRIRYELEP